MNERKFGWLHEDERVEEINERGVDPEQVLMAMRSAYPNFNPYAEPWNRLTWQGQQGACQGHALSNAAQIMCVQQYGVQRMFSRACGYYEAQRHDRISGDKGSTLAGGQKVLSIDGLPLEEHWPYPDRYNPQRPANFDSFPRIYVPSSKQVKDAELIFDLLESGAAVQTGLMWNQSCDRPICDRYSASSSGGHSTLLFGINQQSGNMMHHNSWENWMNNGRNEWTLNFLKEVLAKDRWAVFIAYQAVDVKVDDGIVSTIEE